MTRHVMVVLLLAIAVQVAACRSTTPSLLCGDRRCADGETCRVVETPNRVEAMCVREDGNDAGTPGCDGDCSAAVCGDGVVSAGEICDDGNAIDLDGCKNDCTLDLYA